jgi:hypothetical protein
MRGLVASVDSSIQASERVPLDGIGHEPLPTRTTVVPESGQASGLGDVVTRKVGADSHTTPRLWERGHITAGLGGWRMDVIFGDWL